MDSKDVLSCIEERGSVRSFLDQPLTEEEEQIILHAAMRAPSAANLQSYSIIVVRDKHLKEELSHTCNNQPWIALAPFILVFCADYQRLYDYYDMCGVEDKCRKSGVEYLRPGEQYLLLASCDALIAAQSAVLAAESIGIGSCYVGHIMDYYEKHTEMLELPPYVFPVTLLAFGHPKSANRIHSPRFPQEFMVFENKYRRLNEDELSNCFSRFPPPPNNNRFQAENAGQYQYLRRHSTSQCYWEGIRSLRAALQKHWNYSRE